MFWLLIFSGLLALAYLCLIRPFQYWKRQQVPQYSVSKIYKDTFALLSSRKSLVENIEALYNDFPGQRYVGSYHFLSANLFIRDPELIKQITIKDFDYFSDHRQMFPEETEPVLGKMLTSLTGETWRGMRNILSPSFTSSKLKTIYPLIVNCAKQLTDFLEEDSRVMVEVDLRTIFRKLGCDVIATSACGISINSFKDPDNKFFVMGRKLFNNGILMNMKLILITIIPKLTKFLNINILNKDSVAFFEAIAYNNIKDRETKGIYRPDMIQLLIEARRKSSKTNEDIDKDVHEVIKDKENKTANIRLTDEDIFSQVLIFFLGGFESVSLATTFAAYQLALHPEKQKILFTEIQENVQKFGIDPPYESLSKMKYLDMVISESLRMYPLFPLVDRVCTKPYTIEPKNVDENQVHLKVGDAVFLDYNNVHADPKYFPNPKRFDPERFSDENRANIVSGSYSPFGVGPRNCIGNRFALIEVKLAIYYILTKFEIVVIDKTAIPLQMTKNQINIDVEGGVWVGLKKRNV